MGNFYTNITLKGPEQDRVLKALEGMKRNAYVSPTVDGFTIVYDAECDSRDARILSALASELSEQHQCPALAVLNHDDDVLWYELYVNGSLVDEYNSYPGFDGGESDTPSGGDARKFCETFGVPEKAQEVATILHTPSSPEEYLFAVDRHADLARALGMPDFVVATGYNYIEQGEMPDGPDSGNLKRVTA